MTDNKEYEYRCVGQTPPARRIVGVKINSLNDHIDKAAGACGFGSYIYARLKETNYILGTITEYPVVVRQFFETITPTDLDGVYKRTSKFLFCGDLGEAGRPERAVERKVEETFDHVERRDLGDVGRHVFADFGRGGFGRLAASPEQRKGYEGIVALELPAGLLNLQLLVAKLTVKRLHRSADRIRNKGFDIHIQ